MPSSGPVAMTIAGSDSGGGAGIQADLRTFAARGVFGTCAVTCLTAQNLDGVTAAVPTEPDMVRAQMDAVLAGFDVRAVKTGMLFSRAIVDTVVDGLSGAGSRPLVVDPVMIATSGARLLEEDAVSAYLERLIPMATVVTPNTDELAALSGQACDTHEAAIAAARALLARCGTAVLVKGGHLPGPAHDYLVSREGVREYAGPRHEDVHTHGSGCTYGAAIAAELAHGHELGEAVQAAKLFLAQAFASAPRLRSDQRVLHAGMSNGRLQARAATKEAR